MHSWVVGFRIHSHFVVVVAAVAAVHSEFVAGPMAEVREAGVVEQNLASCIVDPVGVGCSVAVAAAVVVPEGYHTCCIGCAGKRSGWVEARPDPFPYQNLSA